MKRRFDLGGIGITIPANTQSYVFIPRGGLVSTTGAKWARADGEMRLEIGTADAQPAVQFTNSKELSTTVAQAVGPTITANGPAFPSGAGIDIAANAAQYLLMRPGWLVRNTHATDTASCYRLDRHLGRLNPMWRPPGGLTPLVWLVALVACGHSSGNGRDESKRGETGQSETGETPADDADGDGWEDDADCDPANPEVHPGASEVCDNGVDDDCDGTSNGCAPSGEWNIEDVALVIAAESDNDKAGYFVGAAGDVDGDGVDDFLVGATAAGEYAQGPGALYVVRGGEEVADSLGDAWAAIRGTDEWGGVGRSAVGVGDVDGDGGGDLVIWGRDVSLFVGVQAGDTAADSGFATFVAGEPFEYVGLDRAMGDFTGDGAADLVLVAGGETSGGDIYAQVVCQLGEPDVVSTDRCAARVDGPESIRGGSTTAGDFDGDGQDDLLFHAGNATGNPGVILGLHGPLAGHRSWDEADFGWLGGDLIQVGSVLPAVGDIDGDGYDDVAIDHDADASGTLVAYGPFEGTGQLTDIGVDITGAYGGCLATVDFDGDGRDDLVARRVSDDARQVSLVYGPIEGSLNAAELDATFSFPWADGVVTSFADQCASVGDADGDRHQDLLLGDDDWGLPEGSDMDEYADGRAYLLLGSGL